MLIKVMAHEADDSPCANVLLIDGVSDVSYELAGKVFDSNEALQEWILQQQVPSHDFPGSSSVRTREFFRNGIKPSYGSFPKLGGVNRFAANSVHYTREERRHCIIFDDTAYICDDAGKTLEIVRAGGFYTVSPIAA